MNDELPPAPQPMAEEPELIPGGVDGVAAADSFSTNESGLVADLPQADNPATENAPDELAEPEDSDSTSSSEAARSPREATD